MPKPETIFRRRVLDFLRTLRDTKVFPVQQLSISGTPDLLLCARGTFVGLELKSKAGTVSKLQLFQLDEINRCGGVAIVASPDNWDQVKVQLRKLNEGDIE